MLTKFALALLLGAATVHANDSEYRPYRRSMPSGPTRRFARGGKKAGRDGEEVEVREADFQSVSIRNIEGYFEEKFYL